MFEIIVIMGIAILLAYPLGHYMTGVFSSQPHYSDRIFNPIENVIYRCIGINPTVSMNWKSYGVAFLLSNLILGIFAFLILKFQHVLPLNPDGIGSLSWDLALPTVVM